eukprot:210375_1
MNGEFNPNENRMGNFGKNNNYTKSGGGGLNSINDVLALQNDPYKQKPSKWEMQSKMNYERKQKEIAAEQSKFMPQTFKKTHMKQVDNNKQHQPQQPQQVMMNNNNNNKNNFQPPPQHKQHKQHKQQQPKMNNNNNKSAAPKSMHLPEQPVKGPYYNKPKPDPF